MNSSSLFLSVLFFISAVWATSETTDKKKKLQIGIKKRVDPDQCPIKSRKGDTLHMHYTVNQCHL